MRKRQKSLNDRNWKRGVAVESRNIQSWRVLARANKYVDRKHLERLKFLSKSEEESQEIPKQLQCKKEESPENPEIVQSRRGLAVANI